MSTCLFLRCVAHDPPIDSGDVGYQVTDLPRIRREVADRQALLAVIDGNDVTFDNPYTNETLRFLRWHPNCRLELWDEYGEQHSLDRWGKDDD